MWKGRRSFLGLFPTNENERPVYQKKGERIFTFYGVINSQISHDLFRQNVEIGTKQ